MTEDDQKAIARHIRGATVVHQSPFSLLEVPSADVLSEEERERWVVPFYRVSVRTSDCEFLDALTKAYREITPAVVERLLTEFDWRPRWTGAYFAALKRFSSLEDHIGRLLLRSDLCYAGKLYCVALAEFNTSTGLDYLKMYLEYYLSRPDLDYDQGDAMGAIAWLDNLNGTRHLEDFLPLWRKYESGKTWKVDLERRIACFAAEIRVLHEHRDRVDS